MQRLPQYDVFDVPIEDIFYDEGFNCRRAFTPQSVKDLADSIEQHGLQFPVVVQPWSGPPFRLIAGYRRFTAMRVFLKASSVPASVRHDLTEHQARMLNFTENLERKDLNMFEEALAIRALYPEGISLQVAAHELKRPTRWVHIRQRLLTLPDVVQEKAAAGLLSAVNLEAILLHGTPEAQIAAAEAIVAVKSKGRTKYLGEGYRRRFQRARSKAEINKMVGSMITRGIVGLGPRSLAWAAGYIKDEELEADIQATLAGAPILYPITFVNRYIKPPRKRRKGFVV